MPRYANHSGQSGVVSYDVDPAGTSIEVEFASGRHRNYVYTVDSCGAGNVTRMIALAQAGQGLNSFINLHVKYGYAARA